MYYSSVDFFIYIIYICKNIHNKMYCPSPSKKKNVLPLCFKKKKNVLVL